MLNAYDGSGLIYDAPRLRAALGQVRFPRPSPLEEMSPEDVARATAIAESLAYGDYEGILDIFKKAGKAVSKGAQAVTHEIDKDLQSIDPTTPAGRKRLASILPFPLSVWVGDADRLIACEKKSNSTEDRLVCIGDYLLEVLKDIVSSPYFQMALAILTGNVPQAVVVGAQIAAEGIIKGLSNKTVREALHIGQQDIANVSAALRVITSSPDVAKYFLDKGANAFRDPGFYYIFGGVLSRGQPPGSPVADAGLAIAYNAPLLASIVATGPTSSQSQQIFERLHIAPIKAGVRDLTGERGLAAAAGVIEGIGAMIEKIGDGLAAWKPIRKFASAIKDGGKGLARTANDIKRLVNDLQGVKNPPKQVSQAEWEDRLRKVTAERDQARKERDDARAELLKRMQPTGQRDKSADNVGQKLPPQHKKSGAGIAVGAAAAALILFGKF